MAFSIVYTKGQYLAKISELEGYYDKLNQHLERMQALKSEMYNFWEDANAQKTGLILTSEIRHVQNSMDRVHDSLSFYKSTIEKLDGTNQAIGDFLEEVIGFLM